MSGIPRLEAGSVERAGCVASALGWEGSPAALPGRASWVGRRLREAGREGRGGREGVLVERGLGLQQAGVWERWAWPGVEKPATASTKEAAVRARPQGSTPHSRARSSGPQVKVLLLRAGDNRETRGWWWWVDSLGKQQPQGHRI